MSPGHPALSVKVGHAKVAQAHRCRSRRATRSQTYRFPLAFTVVTAEGERTLTLPVEERTRSWAIPMEASLIRVEVDPGFHSLSNMTIEGSRKLLIASLEGDAGVVGRIRAAKALAKEGSIAIDALAKALKTEPFWASVLRLRVSWARTVLPLPERRPPASGMHTRRRAAPSWPRSVTQATPTSSALMDIARNGDPSLQVEGGAVRSLGRLSSGPD